MVLKGSGALHLFWPLFGKQFQESISVTGKILFMVCDRLGLQEHVPLLLLTKHSWSAVKQKVSYLRSTSSLQQARYSAPSYVQLEMQR